LGMPDAARTKRPPRTAGGAGAVLAGVARLAAARPARTRHSTAPCPQRAHRAPAGARAVLSRAHAPQESEWVPFESWDIDERCDALGVARVREDGEVRASPPRARAAARARRRARGGGAARGWGRGGGVRGLGQGPRRALASAAGARPPRRLPPHAAPPRPGAPRSVAAPRVGCCAVLGWGWGGLCGLARAPERRGAGRSVRWRSCPQRSSTRESFCTATRVRPRACWTRRASRLSKIRFLEW